MRNRIKEIRNMRGVSIDKLAATSGLNRSTIMKAEQEEVDTTRVSLGTFNAIANALEVSLMELIDAKPRKTKTKFKKYSARKLKNLKRPLAEVGHESIGK